MRKQIKDEITGNAVTIDKYRSMSEANQVLIDMAFAYCFDCTDCWACQECVGCSCCTGCVSCVDCISCVCCKNCWNCWSCSVCTRCHDHSYLWDIQAPQCKDNEMEQVKKLTKLRNVRLTKDLDERLAVYVARQRRTVSDVIRMLIADKFGSKMD